MLNKPFGGAFSVLTTPNSSPKFNEYKKALESAGLVSSGVNPDTGLVEIVEIKNHPFFIGVQYHPEYKSTVANPHPIFVSFVAAMVKNKK